MEYNSLLFSEVTTDALTKELFSNFLNTSWLRPERALLDAYMISAIQPFMNNFSGNSLDWGCTDASLSFALLGGRFNLDYDDYVEVDWENKRGDLSAGINVDFFDKISKIQINPIEKPAKYKFTHGISWKESHIHKAVRFKVHDLLRAQAFEDKLPYQDNFFNTVLATNLFWITPKELLQKTLIDICLVSKPQATILTIFPQKNAPATISQQLEGADPAWVKKIDRGISSNLLQNAMSLEDADSLFNLCGFRIKTVVEFCPTLVSSVYQIGFRPMFPVFMNMYEKLKKVSPEKLHDIKKQWIATISDFMLPLCENTWMSQMNMPNTWYFFELEKK